MATKTKISTSRTTLASQLSRKFIGHDVNLQRLQADQRRTVFKALKKLEAKLVNKIAQHVGAETFTLERNRALLRETRKVIQTAYDDIAQDHAEMLVDMGAFELEATAKVVNRNLGVDLFAVGVPRTVVESMLSENTVFGAPLQSYWAQQSASLQAKFAVEMRAGVFAGETTGQLIQRVRGTKKNQFQDGLMQTTRRGAEVVVRTSAQSILNDARMAVFQANADVIDGVQAQATLDDRTSDICMARSGFAWTLDGDPMPGTDTDETFPGPPPWHPNCRTTLMPVVKSVGDIIGDKSIDTQIRKEVEKLPKATQASMTGQVAGHLTYEEWLRDQSKAVQLSVLGPGRLALWEKGDISLRDLIDQRGNPLTLKELQKL